MTGPPATCTTEVDLIFVMDASGSIESDRFEQMKSLVSQIVNKFDIDSGNAQVGLLTYSSNVNTIFDLSTYTSRAAVRAAISDLTYTAGNTSTADALAYVRRVMLQPAAGDRILVPNVVVVMTDGGSNDKFSTQVSFVTLLDIVVLNVMFLRSTSSAKKTDFHTFIILQLFYPVNPKTVPLLFLQYIFKMP